MTTFGRRGLFRRAAAVVAVLAGAKAVELLTEPEPVEATAGEPAATVIGRLADGTNGVQAVPVGADYAIGISGYGPPDAWWQADPDGGMTLTYTPDGYYTDDLGRYVGAVQAFGSHPQLKGWADETVVKLLAAGRATG